MLSALEAICDDLVLIAAGRLRFQGSIGELLDPQRPVLRATPEWPEDLPRLVAVVVSVGLEPRVEQGGVRVRATALHVERPATPNRAVRHLGAERVARPARSSGDDVNMPLEQQRRRLATASEPCHEASAIGLLGQHPRLEPGRRDQPLDPADALGLVCRVGSGCRSESGA